MSRALRSRYDAILVGRGTVEADDPELTCRLPGLERRSPVRLVLDTEGRLGPPLPRIQRRGPDLAVPCKAGPELGSGARVYLRAVRRGGGLDLARATLDGSPARVSPRAGGRRGERLRARFWKPTSSTSSLFRSPSRSAARLCRLWPGLPLAPIEAPSASGALSGGASAPIC
jgi:hypothetical protein